MSANPRKHRFGRRSFIKIAAGAATIPIIQACSPSAPPAATQAPATQAPATQAPATQAPATQAPAASPTAAMSGVPRGGVAVATIPAVDTFDPHIGTTTFTPSGAVFESLTAVEVDPATLETRLVGRLAESWEVAPDALSVVFNLRQGVKFHDGTDWNAAVAQWNLTRLRDDERSVAAGLMAVVEDIEVLDTYQLRVRFATPNSVFPMQVSYSGSNGRVRMISQAAYEADPEGFGQNPVGTGAFRFVNWVKDDRITLERFGDYWRTDAEGGALPYLDGLVFRELVDEPTILAEMQAGTIHWATNQLAAATARSLESDPLVEIYRLDEAVSYFMLGFNAKNGPFAESQALRHAVAKALNREAIVQVLSPDTGAPAHQFREPGTMGYNPNLEWPFDLEGAKATFAEEGYGDGLAIHMNTWNREAWIRRAEVYEQQLSPLNITMEIAALEGIDWRASATSNEGYDIALWGEDTYVDPSGMERFMTSAGLGNWMGFELPEVDALFQQGLSELDESRRDQIYQEAAQLFFDAAYVVPIYKEVSPLAKARSLKWGTREFRYYDHANWWLES